MAAPVAIAIPRRGRSSSALSATITAVGPATGIEPTKPRTRPERRATSMRTALRRRSGDGSGSASAEPSLSWPYCAYGARSIETFRAMGRWEPIAAPNGRATCSVVLHGAGLWSRCVLASPVVGCQRLSVRWERGHESPDVIDRRGEGGGPRMGGLLALLPFLM